MQSVPDEVLISQEMVVFVNAQPWGVCSEVQDKPVGFKGFGLTIRHVLPARIWICSVVTPECEGVENCFVDARHITVAGGDSVEHFEVQ